MKAFVIILFSAFYLLTSIGGSFNLHYCGGNLKTISFSSVSEKTCCGKKIMKKGCCHNKTILIKVKDKHQSNKIDKITYTKVFFSLDNSKIDVIYISSYSKENKTPENYHSPPIVLKTPIYLKNRVLII
jgi:hypothetical protein